MVAELKFKISCLDKISKFRNVHKFFKHKNKFKNWAKLTIFIFFTIIQKVQSIKHQSV